MYSAWLPVGKLSLKEEGCKLFAIGGLTKCTDSPSFKKILIVMLL